MGKNKKNFQLFSLKEVAEILGVSYGTAKRLRYQDGFPKPFRIRGLWRWDRNEIENWLLTKRQG